MATSNGKPLNKSVGNTGAPLVYPQELGSKRFPNMVKFYINAKRISAEKNNEIGNARAFTEAEKAKFKNQNRSKADNYESIATNAGAIAGIIGGYSIGKATSGEGVSKLMETAKAALGGLTGGIVASALSDNQESVRLLDDISLYVPQSVIAAYTANWDEVDLGPVAGRMATGSGAIADIMAGETAELVGRGAVAAAANIPAAAGIGDVDLGNVFEATSKKVGNPYKEQLFKSMGFRQFSFQYVFSPKNKKEALSVQEIVQKFKEHMHPEVSDDGMFLIYPSEFQIEFHHSTDSLSNSVINPNLPVISSCALKNVKVTYGPDGMLNTFRGSGGVPTETTMELQFVELETLTRTRIRQSKEDGGSF